VFTIIADPGGREAGETAADRVLLACRDITDDGKAIALLQAYRARGISAAAPSRRRGGHRGVRARVGSNVRCGNRPVPFLPCYRRLELSGCDAAIQRGRRRDSQNIEAESNIIYVGSILADLPAKA